MMSSLCVPLGVGPDAYFAGMLSSQATFLLVYLFIIKNKRIY